MRKQAAAVLVVLLFVALTYATIEYGGLPESAAPSHAMIKTLYTQLLFVALAIFVIVEGLLLWFIYRFRESARGTEGSAAPRGGRGRPGERADP